MDWRKPYSLPKRNKSPARLFSVGVFLFAILAVIQVDAADSDLSKGSDSSSVTELPARLTPTEVELNAWIELLGSSEFRLREQAAEKLSRCDARYIEPLREAARKSADVEIRSRCFLIADAIYDADIGERSRAFLRSADHSLDFGFEAWKPFAEIAG